MLSNEIPHQLTSDNMGSSVIYWRQFRIASDGCCVIGTGHTKQQAMDDAEKNYRSYEEYLAKSDSERLEILLAKPELLHKELNEAIQIIGKFVLLVIKEKSISTIT